MNGSGGGGKNVGHTWNKNVNCIKEQQLLPACYNTCGEATLLCHLRPRGRKFVGRDFVSEAWHAMAG